MFSGCFSYWEEKSPPPRRCVYIQPSGGPRCQQGQRFAGPNLQGCHHGLLFSPPDSGQLLLPRGRGVALLLLGIPGEIFPLLPTAHRRHQRVPYQLKRGESHAHPFGLDLECECQEIMRGLKTAEREKRLSPSPRVTELGPPHGISQQSTQNIQREELLKSTILGF